MAEPDESPVPASPFTPRAFVAFAGGGAKGIAHVGALSALEQRNVEVVAYAGTSAGAIIATLAAAGFKAEQIMHPREPRNVIDLLRAFDETLQGPTDLFGPNGWLHVSGFRTFLSWATAPRLTGVVAILGVLLFLSTLAVGLYGFPIAALVMLLWIVILGVGAVLLLSCLFGLAKLHTLRDALAALLSDKIHPGAPETPVTFADFGVHGRPSLKVVAANLTDRKLELFSPDTTPEVEVADAVAASICLPMIFDLWTFGGRKFVDGGVVSNLPAWPFDEERELDTEAMTVAFAIGELSAEASPRGGPGRLAWLPSLLQTMMFGSTTLSVRAMGPSELITLRPAIGMMDFDLQSDTARSLLRDATAAARAEIDERLFRFPDAYRAACRQVVRLTEETLSRVPHVLQDPAEAGRVRAAVAMEPEGYVHSLRLKFGANFGEDTDQRILLPKDGSLVGIAWRERDPQFDMAPFPADLTLPRTEHRALRRLVWRDLAWSLRVPILDVDETPKCVVTVDGSHRLHDTAATREVFEGLTDEIYSIFIPIVQRLEEVSSDGKT